MPKQQQKQKCSAFLRKTYQMLQNSAQLQNIIRWNQEGIAFEILNTNQFSTKVLPIYFKHNNFQSFVRQLNMYGFHKTRTSKAQNQYSHPKFLRGQLNLVYQITRKVEKKQKNNNTKSNNQNQQNQSQLFIHQSKKNTYENKSNFQQSQLVIKHMNIKYQNQIENQHQKIQNMQIQKKQQINFKNNFLKEQEFSIKCDEDEDDDFQDENQRQNNHIYTSNQNDNISLILKKKFIQRFFGLVNANRALIAQQCANLFSIKCDIGGYAYIPGGFSCSLQNYIGSHNDFINLLLVKCQKYLHNSQKVIQSGTTVNQIDHTQHKYRQQIYKDHSNMKNPFKTQDNLKYSQLVQSENIVSQRNLIKSDDKEEKNQSANKFNKQNQEKSFSQQQQNSQSKDNQKIENVKK